MNKGNDSSLKLRDWVKNRISPGRRAAIRRRLLEPAGFLFRRNLPRLATIYGTDKWGHHWYAAHYARHFQHLRRKKNHGV